MSNEEMQFADPEWQPSGQRNSPPEQEPFHPQPVNTPREEQPGRQSQTQEESNGVSDYYAGYRAHQQRNYTVPPRQQRRGRTRPWFWIICVLLILTFLRGGPFLEDFAPEIFIFGLLILGVIVAFIVVLRSRRRVTVSNTRMAECNPDPENRSGFD